MKSVRPQVPRDPGPPINNRIRVPRVRLIGEDGEQIGVVSTSEALAKARDAGLDLIQIAESDPPVCRILDAGRWRFEKKRAEREQARKQRELAVDVKEIQLRPGTDEHDIEVKARRADTFLAEGDKIKLVVRFRGRENAHRDLGREVISRLRGLLGEHKEDGPLSDMGREMVQVLAPIKSKAEIARQRTISEDK